MNINDKLILNGSCHCNNITYTCYIYNKSNILDILTYKCNCSICSIYRFWEILIKEKDMNITKRDTLKQYQFEPFNHIHYFCSVCGTHPFGYSKLGVDETDNESFYFINVPTINDLSNELLNSLKVCYMDGANDNFKHEPKYKNYL